MAKRPLTDEERYQRLADKRNKRAEQNHPLFAQAGLLHEVAHIWTAGDVKREIEGYAAKLERGRQETMQKAQQLRQEYGELAARRSLLWPMPTGGNGWSGGAIWARHTKLITGTAYCATGGVEIWPYRSPPTDTVTHVASWWS